MKNGKVLRVECWGVKRNSEQDLGQKGNLGAISVLVGLRFEEKRGL